MSFNSNYVSISPRLNRSFDRWGIEEQPQTYRSPFSRDRDRILYSKAFLRLKDKTQVFLAKDMDYLRTRLTHTLEVNQIAKTISNALGLNIELTEAIALGHDVGHTPFGHVGERTLNHLLNACEPIKNLNCTFNECDKGFKHNLQALRILCDLETGAGGVGLNLTKFVLWGIANHSSLTYKQPCSGSQRGICWVVHNHKKCEDRKLSCSYYDKFVDSIKDYWSFEGFVVALADEIAQRHHDIEDSLRYRIIKRDELIQKIEELLSNNKLKKKEDKKNFQELLNAKEKPLDEFLPLFSRFIVNLLVVNAIESSKANLKKFEIEYNINKIEDFVSCKGEVSTNKYNNRIVFSPEIKKFDNDLQSYLKSKVLNSYEAQALDGKGAFIIRRLFSAYVSNPTQLPDNVIKSFYRDIGREGHREKFVEAISGNEMAFVRSIADYIGGMTDKFAYAQYDLLYGTHM